MLNPADIDVLKALYNFERAVLLSELKKVVGYTNKQITRLHEAGYVVVDVNEGEDSSIVTTITITKIGYNLLQRVNKLRKLLR